MTLSADSPCHVSLPQPSPHPPPHNSGLCSHNSGLCSHNSRTCSYNSGTCSHNSGTCSHNSGTCSHNSRTCLHNSGTCSHNSRTCSYNSRTCSYNSGTCSLPLFPHSACRLPMPSERSQKAADHSLRARWPDKHFLLPTVCGRQKNKNVAQPYAFP